MQSCRKCALTHIFIVPRAKIKKTPKRLPLEANNTLQIENEISGLLRLFISSNEVCKTILLIHEQNFIFKDTTMGPMIPKEMKI